MISSTDIPMAKTNVNIAPADDPEISSTPAREDSRAFKHPTSENIPIDAGPNTRYFIFLLNRTEEIDDAKAQISRRTRLYVSSSIRCWSVRTCRPHRTREGG